MLKKLSAAAIALSLAACATSPRFEWGNYENALYAFSKKPEARENYRKALIVAIERGEQSKRLAPGLHAELGYLFLEDGNTAEATAQFEKEMTAFPESRAFLSGVVARVRGGGPSVSSAPSAISAPASR